MVGQHLGDPAFLHQLHIIFLRNLLAQACEQMCSRCGIYHIPHLRLALAAVPLLRDLVVRVHLYAQVLLCIDELDEQGELPSVQFVQRLAVGRPADHLRLIALHAGQHPVLGAPDQRLEYRLEFVDHSSVFVDLPQLPPFMGKVPLFFADLPHFWHFLGKVTADGVATGGITFGSITFCSVITTSGVSKSAAGCACPGGRLCLSQGCRRIRHPEDARR